MKVCEYYYIRGYDSCIYVTYINTPLFRASLLLTRLRASKVGTEWHRKFDAVYKHTRTLAHKQHNPPHAACAHVASIDFVRQRSAAGECQQTDFVVCIICVGLHVVLLS